MPGFFDTIARPFTRAEVTALFDDQRRRDPVGMTLHTGLAALACLLAGAPTSVVEWAALPVLVCFLVRMTSHHRVLRPLWRDPVALLALGWLAWLWLSGGWSEARGTPGFRRAFLGDVGATRFVVMVPLLWAVMDRRRTLAAALVLGVACGQCSQAVHALATATHAAWQPFTRASGRLSGWWDPVVGGSVLCAGLGMHVGAAAFGPSMRARWVGTLGALVTLGCIVLTGTRGAWIGAVMLVLIGPVLALWRVRPATRVLWPLVGACVLAGVVGGVGVLALPGRVGDGLRERLSRGLQETKGALVEGRAKSDTGMRVVMWRWAWEAFKTHPGNGVGAGGYKAWVRAQPPDHSRELGIPHELTRAVHAHSHSWYLHTLATTGVAGAGLLFVLTGLAVRSGLRTAARVAAAPGRRALGAELLDAYAAGPPLALLGLACAGLFDPITTNQQTSYLFWILAALCLPMGEGLDAPGRAAPSPERGAEAAP